MNGRALSKADSTPKDVVEIERPVTAPRFAFAASPFSLNPSVPAFLTTRLALICCDAVDANVAVLDAQASVMMLSDQRFIEAKDGMAENEHFTRSQGAAGVRPNNVETT
jgi:hypothetical protein